MTERAVLPPEYPSNPVLLQLIRSQSFEHKGRSYRINYSTPASICQRYGEEILRRGFKSGLEIGTLFGFSTLHLAEALHHNGGKLDTIDIRYNERTWSDGTKIVDIHEVAERLINESGYSDIVRFIPGNSNVELVKLIEAGKSYDFALIDGGHVFSVAMLDFIFVDRLLKLGGVIALDDIGSNMAGKEGLDGGPNRLLEMIFSSNRYEIIPLTSNIVLCEKKIS
ncbi:MAG TPA: class I SAM-dependent methyltransferase [Candidatus Poseidoniales archaeon]|nr:class I SAM-dependent methyltransferase [Candidatus Poseidoniales archaeon]